MKINVLDKSVYNRIAAGEVVERPYSVIKELVENSIDAGARNISVSIWNGGKDRIEIEDDGCGIEKEELHKVFLPHATSKISCVNDLDSILTLGFRGEALASIASVSKVSIVSKPAQQEFGAKIYSEGGSLSEVEDAPFNGGTKITVDDLFFNTPARQKFLKTSRAEEGDITDIIGRLILANPFIAFKYFVNDKLVIQSYGGGEEEALIAVYGINTVKNCFKIRAEKNGIAVSGYVGRHNFTKPNRTYQTLVINGRYVVNSTVSVAMQNAYQSYLMKRQYPFFVLYLDIPISEVDVNVHPNKTDVRFTNNQVVYGAVYGVVSKVLDGTNEALDIVVDCPKENLDVVETICTQEEKRIEEKQENKSDSYNFNKDDDFCFSKTNVADSGVSEDDEQEKKLNDIFNENKKYLEELERKAKANREYKTAEVSLGAEKNSTCFEELGETLFSFCGNDKIVEAPTQAKVFDVGELKYVGQAMKTYLIFERDEDLFFVDQHAAHERLLFDDLYGKVVSGQVVSQPLLVPFVLNLNSVESISFDGKLGYLKELGFGVEEFGLYSYKITEIPLDVAEISLEKFFADILNDNSLNVEKVPEVIKEKLCQRACKAAIKAGFELSKSEIDVLIKKMDGNMGLKCPHGRPVAVRITRTEIEKWFKRIV